MVCCISLLAAAEIQGILVKSAFWLTFQIISMGKQVGEKYSEQGGVNPFWMQKVMLGK